tara:strand:+ start:370 stop:915 length:546 start_codon:yes stop_codon:yes gene_type:complete
VKKYDCIFLDRDGTLNFDPAGYINSIDRFSFFDFTFPALQLMAKVSNNFCIITNQSGVSRGLIKEQALNEINNFIKNQFEKHSIHLLDIYFCIDHPDQATKRRKPGPGMFLEAKSDHNLNLLNCLMIGDSLADIKAGQNLGMDTMLVLTGHGSETNELLLDNQMPTYIVQDLAEGAKKLCQ